MLDLVRGGHLCEWNVLFPVVTEIHPESSAPAHMAFDSCTQRGLLLCDSHNQEFLAAESSV